MGQKLTSAPGVRWTKAWDANARFRAAELFSNDDSAYRSLTHHIEQHLAHMVVADGRVLDVGCGVGALTASLSALGYNTLGIDPSRRSIEFAKKHNPAGDYLAVSLEKFTLNTRSRFHAVVANMVLHSVANLDSFLRAARNVLREDGVVVATVPHPRFYLQQRTDVDFDDTTYDECQTHWLNFRIHGKAPHPQKVPYFHRPTEEYVRQLTQHGFSVDWLDAPSQVGIGKPRDVMLIVATRSARRSTAAEPAVSLGRSASVDITSVTP